jgi:hypothetical protein
MNTLQKCTEMFAVWADVLSCWKRHRLSHKWRDVKHDVRKCVVYFREFVVSEKMSPVILAAITAHHTPSIKYVITLHWLTGVWEFMYSHSQNQVPLVNRASMESYFSIMHPTKLRVHKMQSYFLCFLSCWVEWNLLLKKFSHTVFGNCCPHLHDTSPGISLLGIYHISYDEKMAGWQWSVKVTLHT